MGRKNLSEKQIGEMKDFVVKNVEQGGSITQAAQKLKIDARTIHRWKKEDEEFEKMLHESREIKEEMKNDIANNSQIKLMQEGHWGATKYQLDRQNLLEHKFYIEARRKDIEKLFDEKEKESIKSFHEFIYGDLKLGEDAWNDCETRKKEIYEYMRNKYEKEIRAKIWREEYGSLKTKIIKAMKEQGWTKIKKPPETE